MVTKWPGHTQTGWFRLASNEICAGGLAMWDDPAFLLRMMKSGYVWSVDPENQIFSAEEFGRGAMRSPFPVLRKGPQSC